MPSTARISPSWKEEVNQRIAAHKNRKPVPAAEQGTAVPEHHAASKRAAAAAARVAARFAKAPSYNELLENEARAAMRAAEAASRAAQQAQAVAESVLAELQAAKAAQPGWQFHEDEEHADHFFASPAVETAHQFAAEEPEIADATWDEPEILAQSYEIRWEPDAPMLRAEPGISGELHETPEWHERAPVAEEGAIEIVEAAQPIHANLIEFPREIVATRKVRPRRAEGPFAQPEVGAQLSIFEVDPQTISFDPVTLESINPAAAPTWMSPEWSGMELEEQPAAESFNSQAELLDEGAAETLAVHEIDQAPVSLRLMAALVDGSLMLGGFLAVTLEFVSRASSLPGMRQAELGAVVGLAITNLIYLLLFYALGNQTPGMRYACIALSTFEGEVPTRIERFKRFASLPLSVLPVGVGVLWSIFDEDHLSWHDRLSRTYLRIR